MTRYNFVMILAFCASFAISGKTKIMHYVPDNNGQRILVANHLLNDAIIPESLEECDPRGFKDPDTCRKRDCAYVPYNDPDNIPLDGNCKWSKDYETCYCDTRKFRQGTEIVERMKKHGPVLYWNPDKGKEEHRKPPPGKTANPSRSDVFGFDQWFKKEVQRAIQHYKYSGKGKAAQKAYLQHLEEWGDETRTQIEETEDRYENEPGSQGVEGRVYEVAEGRRGITINGHYYEWEIPPPRYQ